MLSLGIIGMLGGIVSFVLALGAAYRRKRLKFAFTLSLISMIIAFIGVMLLFIGSSLCPHFLLAYSLAKRKNPCYAIIITISSAQF